MEERYADMLALAADLTAWLEGRVVAAHASGTWAETRSWVRRHRPLAASLAASIQDYSDSDHDPTVVTDSGAPADTDAGNPDDTDAGNPQVEEPELLVDDILEAGGNIGWRPAAEQPPIAVDSHHVVYVQKSAAGAP